MKPDRKTIVPFIADIFHRRGTESYLGENVTMSEHMLQAALLAEQQDSEPELIAAALLHDIGHYTNEFPETALQDGINNFHDIAGATVLEPYFSPRVIACIRHHVEAKRYLCRVDPSYFNQLSQASVDTLVLQGGIMSPDEATSFEQTPYLDAILQTRKWDERAKEPGLVTPDFAHYEALLHAIVL